MILNYLQTKSECRLKATFLYRLLRPEFVKRWECPLSSDAFSKFGKGEEALQNNEQVRQATDLLETEELPNFARHLDQVTIIYLFKLLFLTLK
jgi:hypothetical protein